MNFESRLLQSLDHLEPFRPDRVDQNINFVRLDEERGVADPGNANLALTDFRKLRSCAPAGTLGEERWDQDAGEKIAFVPIRPRTQSHTGGIAQWRGAIA